MSKEVDRLFRFSVVGSIHADGTLHWYAEPHTDSEEEFVALETDDWSGSMPWTETPESEREAYEAILRELESIMELANRWNRKDGR